MILKLPSNTSRDQTGKVIHLSIDLMISLTNSFDQGKPQSL